MALMPPDQASAGPPGAESIEELFAALESPLLGYALRLVGERSLAEDIVQEAFVRAYQNLDRHRDEARFTTWLLRIVSNLCTDQARFIQGQVIEVNGGFLMVDDFWGEWEWDNFHREIKRVFPDREPFELPLEHEIFHIVYDLKKKP